MAYTSKNFKTKKELKEAIAAGETITVYNPSGMFPTKDDGVEYLEGPHYPEPHKWYAQATMKGEKIVAVK